MTDEGLDERTALKRVVDALHGFSDEDRARIWRAAGSFYKIDAAPNVPENRDPVLSTHGPVSRNLNFSDRTTTTAKEFLSQKQPLTDVERVACLAYYLTHYRDSPHFKTLDVSKLNTEAAQLKFSNAAFAVTNAANAGLLAPAGKGNKQISAIGERVVDALPDRDAVKSALSAMRRRRGTKRRRAKTSPSKQ